MKELYVLILSFFLYGFFGWIWESIILQLAKGCKIVNRGFLNGPIIPIYGFGAILIIVLLQRGHVEYPIFSLFIESGVLACLLEYLTSYVMEKLFKRRWWDYSKRPFNLNGRICLEGFVCFGAFGVVVDAIIQPYFDSKLFVYKETVLLVASTVLITLFISDLITTLIGMAKLDERIEELQLILDKEGDKYFEKYKEYRNEKLRQYYVVKEIFDRHKESSESILALRKHSRFVERRMLKAFPHIVKKQEKMKK